MPKHKPLNLQEEQSSKKQKSSVVSYPYHTSADIWQSVFSFFNKKELREVASTCKTFYQLIQQKNLIQKAPWPALDYTLLEPVRK